MNYVYGRNRLAVKSILKDNFTDIEMNKFIGAFEPRIWIPKNNEIGESFIRRENLDIKKFDFFLENLIMSCIIVYWNMAAYGNYHVEKINQAKLLEDLNTIIFRKIDLAHGTECHDHYIVELKKRCDKIRKHFIAYYMKIYNKLKKHWNGKIPDESICKRFREGYFYRKRAKKTTIWSWIDNLDAKEIAIGLVSRGISIDTTACKEALKKRRIAIKDVRKELAGFDPLETAINMWFYSKTEEEQNSIMNYAYKYAAKEIDYNGYCNIIVRVYKYDENWLRIKNDMKLTDMIVTDLKQRFNNRNKT